MKRGNIVILTGAGVSRESGLDTFRDADGIWAKVNLEDVATPQAFAKNPARVHDFYNGRRRQLLADTIRPNAAHFALAKLQHSWKKGVVTIVTQNVDNLHERAGSLEVIHIHGELLKAHCGTCKKEFPWIDDLSTQTRCPECDSPRAMRPHVVWFGEMPLQMDVVDEAVRDSGLFISVGTSGTVYPAAGLVEIARSVGAYTVELNLESSNNASLFDEAIYGPATQVVNEFVARLLTSN